MYNIDVKCTYNLNDIFTEEENNVLSITEKEFVRDALYRQEIMDIFYVDDYDSTLLTQKIYELYKIIKECEFFKKCMKKLMVLCLSEDLELGLLLLFSFDYMYLTHLCICDYLVNGTVNEINMDKLYSAIKTSLKENEKVNF